MDERNAATTRLEQNGWIKRFTGIGRRLEEAVELYEALGFEVHLEPIDIENLHTDACVECFLVQSGRFFTIYTRSPNQKI